MAKLNSCPFCGSGATFSRIPNQGFCIICSGCGAITVLAQNQNQTTLANIWNKRTVRHNFSATSDVKPCPFCASRTSLATSAQNNSIINCANCGAMVSFVESSGLASTVDNWNKRVK